MSRLIQSIADELKDLELISDSFSLDAWQGATVLHIPCERCGHTSLLCRGILLLNAKIGCPKCGHTETN
jgi:predicted nucleic-acid-binding Zn-ribbon protein